MDDVAERWTQQALPLFGAAIAVSVGGALAGLSWLSAAGVGLYLVAIGLFALLGGVVYLVGRGKMLKTAG